MPRVNFVFCFHNHQPVDNFEHVFARAYEDSYLPFLDRIERHAGLKFVAHYSGPLLEWLEANRPDFLDRLRRLAEAGRVELLGGGYYEPIFVMLPEEDVLGQIAMMDAELRRRFDQAPAGIWMTERVWEQSLASLLARAGVRYTVLDDFHFRAAGLQPRDLDGWFLTEDRGKLIGVFPGHEELRYSIPFKDPEWTIDYLARFADESGRPTIVYADDGEKFGLWPHTKKHVYEEGWLDRFLDALDRAADRIRTVTLREAFEASAPRGRVYLPSTAYREMGEWSMPPEAQAQLEALNEALKRHNLSDAAHPFLKGGTWRHFRARYPEANALYGRMMSVSRRVREKNLPAAVRELYRAQCNCGYWHGIFGGLYLPHLRGSIYRHLIAAENAVERNSDSPLSGPEAETLDLDLDGREEVRLFNEHLNVFVAPATGGRILELDVRGAETNLGATLARRPEHYHTKLRRAAEHAAAVRSIHDGIVPKAENLDRYLVYDAHARGSLVDHFYALDAVLDDADRGAKELGDFAAGPYRHEIIRERGRVEASLGREGTVAGISTTVDKRVELGAVPEIRIRYAVRVVVPLEALFGVEFNIAMLSPESPVLMADGSRAGTLSSRISASGSGLSVRDPHSGLAVRWSVSRETDFWTYPVHTVSQTESGIDVTYQGSAVVPHWRVRMEPGQEWTAEIRLRVERS
ncbi:MAG: DUF1926 domain-containing protein [Planctomycetes bacterium]|nr:DUF1926 domain-containing protein [Planctomycetota bacterium]